MSMKNFKRLIAGAIAGRAQAGCILICLLGISLCQTCNAQSSSDTSVPGADWPSAGGNLENTRYSILDRINKSNVRKLGLAWISEALDGDASRVALVVRDGMLFVTAGQYVYALDARTGARIWRYGSVASPSVDDRVLLGVPNGRGVGLGKELVFAGLKDGHVIALNQKSGNLVWAQQTGTTELKIGQMAATAPVYNKGVVYSGLSNGDANLRGRGVALEASTGKRIWQFFSVPDPGDPGHATWPAFNDSWKVGGGGVWAHPSVDPDLGLAYFRRMST